MDRVILHWTAGRSTASSLDKKHYHLLVEGDGSIIEGKESPEDNLVTSDGDYAAHTRGLNTGSIGIGLCGMHGAIESPFNAGAYPLTEKQITSACSLVADLCEKYGIRADRKGVLTHAEVQHVYGVRQRGKWDIARLPFRTDLRGAAAVGDYLRDQVIMRMNANADLMPMLAHGDRSYAVCILQDRIGIRATGLLDEITSRAVQEFQRSRKLVVDGIVGPVTWSKIFASKGS